MNITQRFLNYTQFDTQSSEESQSVPSTPKQLVFAEYLKKELIDEGFSDVEMDDKGYIYATLKANTKENVPVIGFISHYDTSPDCSGADIKPQIVKNYDGSDILLSESIVMSTPTFCASGEVTFRALLSVATSTSEENVIRKSGSLPVMFTVFLVSKS